MTTPTDTRRMTSALGCPKHTDGHFGDVKRGQDSKTVSKAAEGAGIGGGTRLGVGAAAARALPRRRRSRTGLGLIGAGPIAEHRWSGRRRRHWHTRGRAVGAGIRRTRSEYDERPQGRRHRLGTRGRTDHANELERELTATAPEVLR